MNPSYRINWIIPLLLLLPLTLFIAITAIFWWLLTPDELNILTQGFHSYLLYFLGSTAVLAFLSGLGMLWVYYRQAIPAIRLAEEAELIRTGNPSHRIKSYGSPAIKNYQALSMNGPIVWKRIRLKSKP